MVPGRVHAIDGPARRSEPSPTAVGAMSKRQDVRGEPATGCYNRTAPSVRSPAVITNGSVVRLELGLLAELMKDCTQIHFDTVRYTSLILYGFPGTANYDRIQRRTCRKPGKHSDRVCYFVLCLLWNLVLEHVV